MPLIPMALTNTPATFEVDWMNGSQDMQITYYREIALCTCRKCVLMMKELRLNLCVVLAAVFSRSTHSSSSSSPRPEKNS